MSRIAFVNQTCKDVDLETSFYRVSAHLSIKCGNSEVSAKTW